MKKILMMLAALVLTSSFSNPSTITYQGDQYKTGDSISVSGYIAQIGTGHFFSYVIIDENDIRFILPSDFVEDNDLQGKTIRLKAAVELRELTGVSDGKVRIIMHLLPVDFEMINEE